MYIYIIQLDLSRQCVTCLMTCVRDSFVDRKFSETFFLPDFICSIYMQAAT